MMCDGFGVVVICMFCYGVGGGYLFCFVGV